MDHFQPWFLIKHFFFIFKKMFSNLLPQSQTRIGVKCNSILWFGSKLYVPLISYQIDELWLNLNTIKDIWIENKSISKFAFITPCGKYIVLLQHIYLGECFNSVSDFGRISTSATLRNLARWVAIMLNQPGLKNVGDLYCSCLNQQQFWYCSC